MAEARLKVNAVGPLVSIQDGGRRGLMRYGVPASGPMDRFSHNCANQALGVEREAATVEVSMGGLDLECLTGELTLAIAGACNTVKHQGIKQSPWCVLTLRQGEHLSIKAGAWGSFCYLGFAGALVCDQWLGHAATYSLAGFGGGSLHSGQEIVISNAQVVPDAEGALSIPEIATASNRMHVVLGPQNQHFTPESITLFTQESYRLSSAYDRMGVRLEGAALESVDALSIPSEPIVRGSVQVSGDGTPTVLLADHQTTGGYPKIATLLSTDIDRFVQLRAGESVCFHPISSAQAVSRMREATAARGDYLELLTRARGSLTHRLMRENLIGGVVSGQET